ncbi:MAG: ABC transporter permease [Peptococcaceae bacterium]|jgi:ABC-type antimicrobial peptide transport system permease subunit|nr:ABC transporter permease [Peptococcaceae bacterium]
MNNVDIFRVAYGNLFRRKVRAILTIVGVFIGTMAIVVMMSLGIGLQDSTEKQMSMWGDINVITVNQGRSWDPETGEYKGNEQRLNDEAVARMTQEDGVLAVMPSYQIGGEVKYGSKIGWVSLYGVDPETFTQMSYAVTDGRMLREGESGNALVGWQVINQFYDPNVQDYWRYADQSADSREMLGQVFYMELRNNYNYEIYRKVPLTVVGVLEGEYKNHAYNVYAPLSDVAKWRAFLQDNAYMTQEQRDMEAQAEAERIESGRVGIVYEGRSRDSKDYDQIMINCKNVVFARQVAAVLREEGYNLYTMADSMQEVEKQTVLIQAVLGGIGGITLLVASIGIANTMIMAIYERTREIGVMKVIGATGGDVLRMFLMEAGLIGVCGGLLGLAFSLGVSQLINYVAGDFMSAGMGLSGADLKISLIPPYLMAFALIFAFVVGMVAGIYPAWRAAKLSPITAIRNE